MSTPEDQKSKDNQTVVFTTPSSISVAYAPGDVIGDSYVLLSLLARGGMGVLFKAQHIQLDRTFALKLLHPSQISETNWRRFELEGRALAQLSHPNIVQIYNMGVDTKGCPFYVMELLEGQSMDEYLEGEYLEDEYSSAKMPLAQFIQSFKDVCAALQLTHSKGIVHRDIKPSNLFIVDSGTTIRPTKVVDFGIARLTGVEGSNVQGLTRPGEVFGSPLYMSPEQTQGKVVTSASDIYSLGCTMFAALTGDPPFKGKTAIETMMMHQLEEVPRFVRPDISPEQNNALNDIIAKCTEKAVEDRFQNVAEIAEQLSVIKNIAGENLKQNQTPEWKNFRESDPEDENSDEPKGHDNFKKTLIIASSVMLLAGLVLGMVALKIKEDSSKLQLAKVADPTAIPDTAEERNGRFDLYGDQVPDKTNLANMAENYKHIAAISTVVTTKGKSQRIFTFPSETSIGTITGTKKDSIKQRAKGHIDWPDDNPVHFIAEPEIDNYPDSYGRFDDRAISNLELKEVTKLPPISVLARWKNLQALTFRNCYLDSDFTRGLGMLPRLENLTLRETDFNIEALKKSLIVLQLKALQLDKIKNHSQILELLTNSPTIRHLELRKMPLSVSDLKLITTLPELKTLDLRASNLPPSAMDEISKLPGLKNLLIEEAIYNPRTLLTLGKSSSLIHLHISNDKPDQATIKRFRRAYPHIILYSGAQRIPKS